MYRCLPWYSRVLRVTEVAHTVYLLKSGMLPWRDAGAVQMEPFSVYIIYIYVYTQIGLSSPSSSYTPSHTGHTALSDVCEAFCLELLVVCFLCFALAFFAAFCCFSSSLFFLCFSCRFHLFFFLCFSDLLCLPILKESRHLFTREVAVQLTFL